MASSQPTLADLQLGPLFAGQQTMADFAAPYSHADLVRIAAEFYDAFDAIVAGAADPAAVFVPTDPTPEDPGAQGWTIGHVVAHLTAGAEEGAANAVTLARSVETNDRLRYETPWEEVDTMAKVRQRLAESRRMTFGFLQAWPDQPNLDLSVQIIPQLGPINAIGRQLLGFGHGRGHLDQLREIVLQAGAA